MGHDTTFTECIKQHYFGMVFNQWLAPASIKQNPAFMPEAVPLITFIPSGCSHRRPWIWERIWLNLLCGRRRSQLSLVKVPIIWKVANCLENRKEFKDLINLKSLLFIARLNSNQFVGTQRVCDVSVRCVYVRTTACIINLKSLSSQPDLRCYVARQFVQKS